MIAWLVLLALAALMLFLTAPNFDRRRMDAWRGLWFAHRGLHDIDRGIVENTLPAFDTAVRAGYGMELDVQLTKDGQLVVFHDDDLQRLADDPRRVDQCTLAELQAMSLGGVADAHAPTFAELLQTVDGRTPLLVELKHGRADRRLCRDVMAALDAYHGPFIVESFNPLIVGWFRRNAPEVVRGQLVSPMRDYVAQCNQIGAFCMSGLLANCIGRPDFVAYDAAAQRFFSPHFQRLAYRTPMAAWTVRTEELAALTRKRGEIGIFETIRPERRT